MLLKKVRIQNFRCFKDVEVELGETTVLIGENNSGKTSFLDALRICFSRTISRKGAGLEDYDHHLASSDTQFEDIEPLSITLYFLVAEEASEELVQALGDVRVFDDDETSHVILRLTSVFDKTANDYVSEWSFLDCSGNPLGPKTKRPQLLANFLQFKPLFYLTALRDVAKEFHGRSTFWAPFLRNPDLPNETREKLQEELNALNDELLKSHSSLQSVKTHLEKVQYVVSSEQAGKVDIEALPGRITDLLSKTQINITSNTGAKLPLDRHGSGTQSLAVIFLFEAFLATMLADQYNELSEPLLTLEEPEAHLHPCAVRSLWSGLEAIPGQKIITTHSGDLLGRVPLKSVRRFCRIDGTVAVRQVSSGTLTEIEKRKIDFHLKASRGELLFARCWLLGEGESEYWLFNEVANVLGYDLDRLGVRVVGYQNSSGITPLLKLANALGINWFVASDGDQQGQSDMKNCKKYLDGRDANKQIYRFKQPNIEVFLCESGFGAVYENHISPQKQQNVSAQTGSREYWEQVVKARDDTPKPDIILQITDSMRSNDHAVPDELGKIIKAAIALAEAQS